MRHIVANLILERQRLAFLDTDERTAIVIVVLAVLLAWTVDRALRRAQSTRVISDRLDASADTRLRFLRRVIEVTILTVGIALAVAQFTELDRLAASVLASSAIAAVVVGFAARQTFANVIAGILLAVTQPLRLGDVVTIEGECGTVEDVRLTYTYLRTASGTRIVIPNERLAAAILHNDTVLGLVSPEASIWVPATTDLEAAIEAIQALEDVVAVTVAESAAEGVRLAVSAAATSSATRAGREAELRRAALRAVSELQAQGDSRQSM
ncbi:MAG TPA: mechanosensitive ion channel domain-containing protein [Solirubrobacteraceae bacterium]|nr:mechanosensitive ion channel domain-containing protein [Solirubrobacteraceae bacterium]